MNEPDPDPTAGPRARGRVSMPDQSWLELFYDLVFVAAILVLSSAYSKDFGWSQTVWLIVVFSLVWATWLTTTLLLNLVTVHGLWINTLLVSQMVLVLLMAVYADDTRQDHTEYVGSTFALILILLALMYRAVRRQDPELRRTFAGRGTRCLVTAALFLATTSVLEWWYIPVWMFGLMLVLLPARRSRHNARIDAPHLVHRFGEFTIIMLGEAFVKIGLIATEERLDRVDLIGLPLTFVLFFAIWWLYFTDIPRSGLPASSRRRTAWMMGHFPLQLCITALAVGMSKLLLPTAEALGASSARLVCLPLTFIALSLALLNFTLGTPLGRRRGYIHVLSALALLAVWGSLRVYEKHDLEATALLVTGVLALTGWRIRRIPEKVAVQAAAGAES